MARRYEVGPRPADLGGGWRLRMYDGEQETGVGVFTPDDPSPEAARDAYTDACTEGESWVSAPVGVGILVLDAARALKAADPAHTFALWAAPSPVPPNWPPPSPGENQAFTFVRTGPQGFTATGLLFWDESLAMAENLACCVNEEFGLEPEEAERMARLARQAGGEVGHD